MQRSALVRATPSLSAGLYYQPGFTAPSPIRRSTPYNRATFAGDSAAGYTDYPALQSAEAAE
jgi:hypothetical protein